MSGLKPIPEEPSGAPIRDAIRVVLRYVNEAEATGKKLKIIDSTDNLILDADADIDIDSDTLPESLDEAQKLISWIGNVYMTMADFAEVLAEKPNTISDAQFAESIGVKLSPGVTALFESLSTTSSDSLQEIAQTFYTKSEFATGVHKAVENRNNNLPFTIPQIHDSK